MNNPSEPGNEVIKKNNNAVYEMLSDLGKRIYMPKGIIYQSNEAKEHADKYNASAGIASENIGFNEKGEVVQENIGMMALPSVKKFFSHLDPKEIFNYAPPSGVPELRSKWKQKVYDQNPDLSVSTEISLPIVVGGLTHGISTASDLFVGEDDEVILPEMMWENYDLIFHVRYKAKLKTYKLFNDNLTGFNHASFEEAIKSSKKDKLILLFNFPNNPTGYTPTNDEMNKIVEITKKYADAGKKIIILCDDAYYGLFYREDIYTGSIFSKFAGIHENILSIKVDGVSKEDYAWGFRVGFVTFAVHKGTKEVYTILEEKATASIRSSVSSCSRIAQSIFVRLIGDKKYNKEKEQKYNVLMKRENEVKETVYAEEYKGLWEVYPFNSGYFMCLKIKGVEAEKVRSHALKNYGLGTIALGENLRVAFSCIEQKYIEEVFDIIAKSIRELRGINV